MGSSTSARLCLRLARNSIKAETENGRYPVKVGHSLPFFLNIISSVECKDDVNYSGI